MVNTTTEFVALGIATITLLGLLWRKVVKPLREAWRVVKAWMKRVEDSISLVEEQMKPNSGKTLWDKSEQASAERKQMSADIAEIRKKVNTLLAHDRDRDQPGKRYGESEDDA